MAHRNLLVPPSKWSCTNHYGTLEGGHRTRTRLEQSPQLNWRLPTISRELPSLRNNNNHLGYSKYPRGTSTRALQVPKSNKLLNFNFHVSPWRTQTDATDAMGKNTRSAQSSSLSNLTKATNSMEEQERKNKEEHQIPPRSRPASFPSLRGEMDWWNSKSRSPLSFPSNLRQESWRNRE